MGIRRYMRVILDSNSVIAHKTRGSWGGLSGKANWTQGTTKPAVMRRLFFPRDARSGAIGGAKKKKGALVAEGENEEGSRPDKDGRPRFSWALWCWEGAQKERGRREGGAKTDVTCRRELARGLGHESTWALLFAVTGTDIFPGLVVMRPSRSQTFSPLALWSCQGTPDDTTW